MDPPFGVAAANWKTVGWPLKKKYLRKYFRGNYLAAIMCYSSSCIKNLIG